MHALLSLLVITLFFQWWKIGGQRQVIDGRCALEMGWSNCPFGSGVHLSISVAHSIRKRPWLRVAGCPWGGFTGCPARSSCRLKEDSGNPDLSQGSSLLKGLSQHKIFKRCPRITIYIYYRRYLTLDTTQQKLTCFDRWCVCHSIVKTQWKQWGYCMTFMKESSKSNDGQPHKSWKVQSSRKKATSKSM